ncbi:hypothetical protein PV327_009124 [Microctonus hyperodae]|uniref:ASCH domain-containing protein n=1 Tax=Microctonus hyperodae TaxID=165561 RepID=A0AA39FTT9_MICHY|nr:hypothetical protein PV327_009124 [Microctonus hyperodae]
MEQWIHRRLSDLLDFPVPEELTQYILQIQNEKDLDDYLKTLLNFDNPTHRLFVFELKTKRVSENVLVGYKKSKEIEESGNQKQSEKKKSKSKDNQNVTAVQDTAAKQDKNCKKKSKFINFYNQDDKQVIWNKNRLRCDCEAKSHSLVNNCLNCGRIVCIQEGSGPCFHCGELVCTPDQQSILCSNTKQSDTLYNKLMEQKPGQGRKAALLQRDKLLEYDRDSAKRTHVIDDECDYYQSSDSVWLSENERKEIQKHEEQVRNEKYGSRLTKKVTLDIYGRQIIEEPDDEKMFNFQKSADLTESMIRKANDNADTLCPTVEFDRPQYIETDMLRNVSLNTMNNLENISRIQDKELLDMIDNGVCLSLHQPYASLLIAGIKMHEGRTWYSAHRGRLWIAAAAKIASTEEITALEQHYRVLINDNLKFPKTYPTGCLLGCVTVTDVLPQVEYKKIYPQGDSESPYVFICSDPRELSLKFPMQGKHKIYKLDKQIHQAAVKCLMQLAKTKH